MAENEAKQAPLQAWTGVQSILSGIDQARIQTASSLDHMRIFEDIEAQNKSFAAALARSMNGIGQIGESLATVLDSFAARTINVTSVFDGIEAQNNALFAALAPSQSLIEAATAPLFRMEEIYKSLAPLPSREELYNSLHAFDVSYPALASFWDEPFAPPPVEHIPATPRPPAQLPPPAQAHATPHETKLLAQLEDALATGALSPHDALERIARHFGAPKPGPKKDAWTMEQACELWCEWQQAVKHATGDRFARDRNISKATMYRIFDRFGLKRR